MLLEQFLHILVYAYVLSSLVQYFVKHIYFIVSHEKWYSLIH
jgi:hypothetical protein